MMHVKIVKPSPRFEPPTLGKVSKHATKWVLPPLFEKGIKVTIIFKIL
jgi:hypothetical protein